MSEKRFDLPLTDAYTWIESSTKKPVSEFGKAVATIIGRAWKGIYHLENVLKSDWSNEQRIEILVYGGLSTFDFNHLSTLVILCHDACIRLEVNPCNFSNVKLAFYARMDREGPRSRRLPTIESAIEMARTGTL